MNHFQGQRIISDQVGPGELGVVWRELSKILAGGVPGDVVEFGCYVGTTSLYIRRLLDEAGQSEQRAFHAYDSFAGLPEKGREDLSAAGNDFQPGTLQTSKKEFLRAFQAARLRPPIVHKAWFSDLADDDLPPRIALAFLDGDFYDSILDSLKLVWPRMSPGGVVLIDDFGREALPGVERAVHDFFGANMPVVHHEHNIAIISVK